MTLSQDNIKYMIKPILRQYGCRGINSASNEIAKKISDAIEREYMNTEWTVAHDFSPELEKVVKRLEKGLSMNLFKRTPAAATVYKWILEQEADGKKLEVFMKWATSPVRIQYVGKYRSKPENIIADYPQAFLNTATSAVESRTSMLETISDD